MRRPLVIGNFLNTVRRSALNAHFMPIKLISHSFNVFRPATRWLVCACLWVSMASMSAAYAESDWNHWRDLMAVRPAQVLQEIQGLPGDTWTGTDKLQAALLITRAQLELGLIDDMTRGLAEIQTAVVASNNPALQAQWHALQGCSARDGNDFDEAHRQWEKSLTLARAVNDIELQSFVLTQQADVYINRHDLHSAAMAIEADRVISEASSDEQMKARHVYWGGVLQMTIEDGVRAAALFTEAAQRFKALNNPTWESDSQRLLANALLDSEHPADALAPAQRAVDLLEQIDDPAYLALAQGSLALALVFNDKRSRALELSRKSATAARSFRDGEWKTSMLISHAEVLSRCGDADGAIEVLRREVQPRLPSESALPATNRHFQLVLAEALSAAGHAEEARTAWHDVLRLSRRNFDRVLANQLTVQRAELEKQRLQRENELLEQRSQQFERALKAESHARSMTTAGRCAAAGCSCCGRSVAAPRESAHRGSGCYRRVDRSVESPQRT